MNNTTSLFERIGGANAIQAAVDILYQRLLSDDKVSHYFKSTDMNKQSTKMRAFLAYAFGANMPAYSMDKLKEVHSNINISEADFTCVGEHLVATLKELNVNEDMVNEVMAIVISVKNLIVKS